jgi:undecaprenyl-diphosphatase
MTFLLVMLHTGTMFAVIAYFWNSWRRGLFSDPANLRSSAVNIASATAATLAVGFALKILIEKILLHGTPKNELEDLFGHLPLVGSALLAAGILIIATGLIASHEGKAPNTLLSSIIIGISQGICLPFRGLSRSGTTISTGMLLGIPRRTVEEFSFALAVVITPPAIAKELLRLIKSHEAAASPAHLLHLVGPGVFGMAGAFVAGLLALRLLSSWLEKGHWAWFGWYCVGFSGFVFLLASRGY